MFYKSIGMLFFFFLVFTIVLLAFTLITGESLKPDLNMFLP